MNSIDSVFDWLLAATLRASVLAVVIFGIQWVLRHRLPAGWRHALWLPVLAVLVLPVLPEASFGLFPRKTAAPPPVAETLAIPEHRLVQTDTTAAIMAVETTPLPPQIANPSASVITTGWNPYAIAWLAGALGVMAAGLIGYHRNLRQIQLCATAPDRNLQAAIDDAAREIRLKRVPQAMLSPSVASPAVTGFARPLLLLPARFPEGFTAAETRLILLHEFSHLKRHDLPLNWLICVLQALHWFNPLLWFAFARMRADREAACDARVLSIDATDHRAEYGGALLKLQSVIPSRTLSLGFVGIFERGSEIKARIRSISVHRPGHFVWQAAGGAILALLMVFGVTKGQQTVQSPAGTESALANDPALPINDAAKKAILEKLPMDKDGKIDWKTIGRKAAQHQPRRGAPADRLELELLQRDLLHLRKLLLEMSAEDLSAQLDEIAALDLDARTRGQLNSSISGALAQKDPKMLLEKFSGELGDKDSAAQWVMRHALDRWAKADPTASAAWLDQQIAAGKFGAKALDQGDFSLLLMESAVVKNLLMIDPAAATARVMALPEDRRPEFFRKWNYGHLEEQTDGAMAKLIRDTLPPDKVTGSLVHQAVQLRMQGDYGRMDRFIARANASDEEKAAIAAALMKIDSR